MKKKLFIRRHFSVVKLTRRNFSVAGLFILLVCIKEGSQPSIASFKLSYQYLTMVDQPSSVLRNVL